MVCTLKECHEVGDHIFHVCTVDKTLANENEEALFAWKGYAVLNQLTVLTHCPCTASSRLCHTDKSIRQKKGVSVDVSL